MFNNLIESSSHRSEFRRRGSFFLFTTASYALFFVIAGVVSIYAYDARMEDQSLELVTMMPLVDLPTPKPTAPAREPRSTRSNDNSRPIFDERRAAIASVNRPDVAPKDISTKPNPDLPIRDGVRTIITGRDLDAAPSGGISGTGRGGGTTNPGQILADVETPPPPPPPKPKPPVISKGVITSQALALPKPEYPRTAKEMRIQGKVNIQVLIDETGRVMSARAIDGHPLLKQASERAAYQARFSPTFLGEQPVKVSGVISYNFMLQ